MTVVSKGFECLGSNMDASKFTWKLNAESGIIWRLSAISPKEMNGVTWQSNLKVHNSTIKTY
jgi:hypothetical protein